MCVWVSVSGYVCVSLNQHFVFTCIFYTIELYETYKCTIIKTGILVSIQWYDDGGD